jgi:arylsulfatase A-like enzyme
MTIRSALTRRSFLGTAAAAAGSAAIGSQKAFSLNKPNVIIIITDDQGFGDIGYSGNTQIRTPVMDQLAKESIVFDRFYVSPVCAPTRACLMTGRYNYRTGAIDTWLGRAMMHSDETTMAEIFKSNGYKTGIFGKWHLGDNYPLRPGDQGFEESLIHKGGGITQPSGPPGDHYTEPLLYHNNKPVRHKGYCTDIFTDAAIQFVRHHKDEPFFAYLATNAPHTPLEIDNRYVKPYLDMGLDETTAKIYGMVENIDENMGRLFDQLKRLNLEDDTIVIFLTDNGPQQRRYNANLRGLKGSTYEGGIRALSFIRWPAQWRQNVTIKQVAAHIDLLPTLIEACNLRPPQNLQLDGRSLFPLLKGVKKAWPQRTLFIQWHRGDEPEPFRNSAAFDQKYKLVNGTELYDIETDPYEKNDIAKDKPDVVQRLRQEYEAWFQSVSSTRGYAPPRIYIGSEQENPVILTRQDWRGPDAGWGKQSIGYWEVDVQQAQAYSITLRFNAVAANAVAHFKWGELTLSQKVEPGALHCVFPAVQLPHGPGRFEPWIETNGKKLGVNFADVYRL